MIIEISLAYLLTFWNFEKTFSEWIFINWILLCEILSLDFGAFLHCVQIVEIYINYIWNVLISNLKSLCSSLNILITLRNYCDIFYSTFWGFYYELKITQISIKIWLNHCVHYYKIMNADLSNQIFGNKESVDILVASYDIFFYKEDVSVKTMQK